MGRRTDRAAPIFYAWRTTVTDAVLYKRDGAVGVITLNRGDNRNSMTPELLDAFGSVVAEAKADNDARCVVITGNGNCFSAGADLKSNLQRGGDRQSSERSYAMYEPFLSVLDIEIPVVAAMNGHAVGGGFGLALVCDIRIANRDAKYGANFSRLGIHPGMAVTYLLPRLVGVSRAAELLFTGRLFRGAEAAAIGLASEALDGDEVLAHSMKLAQSIAQSAPIAVRMCKRSLYDGLEWNPKGAAHREAFAQAITLETEDAKEGTTALLEKRDPTFHGR
jgi:enoyl-CoA hydratase/carnithine racemase